MAKHHKGDWRRPALRLAGMILAAVTLSGCIIVPGGYYHPHYYHY